MALARPPESVTIKEILDIVSDANLAEVKTGSVIADVLQRRDQAVEQALAGTTLASLASHAAPSPSSYSHADAAHSNGQHDDEEAKPAFHAPKGR